MRLVLDTNVIISAAFWGGKPRQILELAHAKHTLCFSLSTLRELEYVLKYQKFQARLNLLSFSTEEFIERLTEHVIIISDPAPVHIIKKDSSDNKFLACAIVCQADLIISGDKHLLDLEEYERIPILHPSQALQRLN